MALFLFSFALGKHYIIFSLSIVLEKLKNNVVFVLQTKELHLKSKKVEREKRKSGDLVYYIYWLIGFSD